MPCAVSVGDWVERCAAHSPNRSKKNRAHHGNSATVAVYSVRCIGRFKVMLDRSQCTWPNVAKNREMGHGTKARQHRARPKWNTQRPCSPRTTRDRGDTLCKYHTKAISRRPLKWRDAYNRAATTWTAAVCRHRVGSACWSQRYSIRTWTTIKRQRQRRRPHRPYKTSKLTSNTCNAAPVRRQHLMRPPIQRRDNSRATAKIKMYTVTATMTSAALKCAYTTIGSWFRARASAGDQTTLLGMCEGSLARTVPTCKPHLWTNRVAK